MDLAISTIRCDGEERAARQRTLETAISDFDVAVNEIIGSSLPQQPNCIICTVDERTAEQTSSKTTTVAALGRSLANVQTVAGQRAAVKLDCRDRRGFNVD